MSFAPSIEIKTVTFKDWGYYQDDTYINNSGGFVSGDTYWQIKGAIDVSYEASVGGSFQIGGMTFFESNRTNVNFYSSETVDSSKRISTVYLSSQNQVVSVPSDAKIMVLCVRTISPDESKTVTVTLRQQTTIWNTSDGMPPKAGTIYNYNGTIAHQIGKLYEFNGLAFNQIAKVYDWDGTVASLIYSGEEVLYDGGMVVQFEDYGYVSNGTYVYTTRTDNGTNLFAKTHYNIGGDGFYEGYAGWRTQQIIDLSQYSTISIKARVQTYWNSYCGVKIEFWGADNKSVGSIDIQKDVSSTNDSEWTFDISAFNDACKVGVTAWQTYSNGRGAEFNLYKMVLS